MESLFKIKFDSVKNQFLVDDLDNVKDEAIDLSVSSSIFNRFSLLDGNVSITSVINSSSIVITLIAARFILKEKLGWQKYIMIFGITICVFILAIL